MADEAGMTAELALTKDDEDNVIWSQAAYSFLDDYWTAPDTVNPSLWENTKNSHAYGLFEVCPDIYQACCWCMKIPITMMRTYPSSAQRIRFYTLSPIIRRGYPRCPWKAIHR